MATIREILAGKGTFVHSIGCEATVLDAAQLMNEHKIGCLVVLERGEIRGIFTERDVLSRVVAECRDPATTQVFEVMTQEVVCCPMQTDIEEARHVFANRRIRHMPVVDEDLRLLGLVSIGDVNAFRSNSQEQTIFWLNEYIYGRT